jgi:hypothetical protein
MPFAEATQLVLGFSIPFFLTEHVLQTRVADTFYGARLRLLLDVLLRISSSPIRCAAGFSSRCW